MATVLTDTPPVVVTCVHGTWAKGQRWPAIEEAVRQAFPGGVECRYFHWSGRNSLKVRMGAASRLRDQLRADVAEAPGTRHVLIAHSYGAAVVLRALDQLDPLVRASIHDVVLLSPVLLSCELVENPANAANRLMVGALTLVPALLVFTRNSVRGHGWTDVYAILAAALVVAAWLAVFWPSALRRRATTLASQLAMPAVHAPGLVVRARRDEAVRALGSVAAFGRVARFVRSRILTARGFSQQTDRHLGQAGTWLSVLYAIFDAVTLLPSAMVWGWQLSEVAHGGRWVLATAMFPYAVVLATGAMVIAGGSLLLLFVLPIASFLLWPFGILPTRSAPLLTVSVEEVPSPGWTVVAVTVEKGWRHSTYSQSAAAVALSDYLRASVARAASGLASLGPARNEPAVRTVDAVTQEGIARQDPPWKQAVKGAALLWGSTLMAFLMSAAAAPAVFSLAVGYTAYTGYLVWRERTAAERRRG